MTCTGCEEHVMHAVNQLDGVLKADASYENANANITFDGSKTTLDEIVAAVNETGYKVTDVKRQTN